MARYGTWRPLASNFASQPRMAKYDLVILHTMVGSLSGTDAYFKRNGYGGSFSHFGVGHDGTTYQWQDTAYRSAANGAANPRSVTVETADVGTGFPQWNTNDGGAVPAWTPAQVDELVDIVVWACRTHNIPCRLVTSSKPSERGIGYHRLGVPGYAVAGGELWSSARGKVCPGNRRIAQIPGIVFRAAAILAGTGGKVEPTIPAKKKDNPMLKERLEGTGDYRLPLPVGSASRVTARAWISAVVEGPLTGAVRYWFQSDTGGISDKAVAITFKDGRSSRTPIDVPDGTTQINIQHTFPNGGTILVETESK